MTTIGFFGDSFCAEQYNEHSVSANYTTYINLLSKHYNADIVNLGFGGSSVYDTILNQLQPLINKNNVPDICIFCWTNFGRLYHPKVRNLNHGSVRNYRPTISNFSDTDIWRSAKMFYDYIYDNTKEELEYKSLLHYIDTQILTKLPSNTKIVHLWSMGLVKDWDSDNFRPDGIEYVYTWTTGSEIRPALLSLSLCDHKQEVLANDHRCNHLDGQFKNDLVFDWIRHAIDNQNYFWDHSEIIDKLHNTHS